MWFSVEVSYNNSREFVWQYYKAAVSLPNKGMFLAPWNNNTTL